MSGLTNGVLESGRRMVHLRAMTRQQQQRRDQGPQTVEHINDVGGSTTAMRRMHVRHYPQTQSPEAERAYHDRLAAKGERDES